VRVEGWGEESCGGVGRGEGISVNLGGGREEAPQRWDEQGRPNATSGGVDDRGLGG
jgi:hypothetical protein